MFANSFDTHCVALCTTGVHERQTEAGSTSRARRQGLGQDNQDTTVGESQVTALSLPAYEEEFRHHSGNPAMHSLCYGLQCSVVPENSI